MEATLVDGLLTLKIPLSQGELAKSGRSLICADSGKFLPVPGTDYSIKYIVIRSLEGNLGHLVRNPS